jgi:hypothetical protein
MQLKAAVLFLRKSNQSEEAKQDAKENFHESDKKDERQQ